MMFLLACSMPVLIDMGKNFLVKISMFFGRVILGNFLIKAELSKNANFSRSDNVPGLFLL